MGDSMESEIADQGRWARHSSESWNPLLHAAGAARLCRSAAGFLMVLMDYSVVFLGSGLRRNDGINTQGGSRLQLWDDSCLFDRMKEGLDDEFTWGEKRKGGRYPGGSAKTDRRLNISKLRCHPEHISKKERHPQTVQRGGASVATVCD